MKCLELFSSPLAFSLPHAVRFTVCSVGRVLPSSFNDLLWITVQTCDVTSPAPPQCHVLFHRPQTSWRCPLNKWHTCLSSGVSSSSQELWASSHRHFLHVLFPSSLSSVCFGGVREAVVLLPSSASLVFCQQIDLSLSSCWADIIPRTLSVWSQQAMYMNVNMEKHSRWTICALAASWSAHTSNEYVTLCRRLYLSNVVSIVQHVPFYAINTFLVIFTCAPAGWAHSCLSYRRWKQEVKRRLPDFFHIWQMLHST